MSIDCNILPEYILILYIFDIFINSPISSRDRRGRDRMVVGLRITYANLWIQVETL
jgi:hypothetical protein